MDHQHEFHARAHECANGRCRDPELCRAVDNDPAIPSAHLPGFISPTGRCENLVFMHGDAAHAFLGDRAARERYLRRLGRRQASRWN